MKNALNLFISKIIFICFLVLFLISGFCSASETNGTINSAYRYAWSENAGWIDFGTTGGNIHITDAGFTGYAWGENIGWISLNCSNDNSCATSNYKVSVGQSGILSGYAWSENAGWIDFSQASIYGNGNFQGYAWGENIGWIAFNCWETSSCSTVNYQVTSDYIPKASRSSSSGSSNSSSTYPVGGSSGGSSSISAPTAKAETITQLQGEIERIQKLITGLKIQLSPNFQPTALPPSSVLSAPQASFTQDIKPGAVAEDIRNLQKFLNNSGFFVASVGQGSLGKETNFFGKLTKQALIKFQEIYAEQILKPVGLIKGTGFFGPSTRNFINSLKNQENNK